MGNNSLGCSTPLAGMHPPRYLCSNKLGLHALAEQPSESVLCLKLRFGPNSLEFFFTDKASNSHKECQDNEGCIGDSRTCLRALLETERGATFGDDVASRVNGDRTK